MRHAILSVVALLSLSAGVARAQGLTGTWQGTLDAGRPLRIVMSVTNGDAGSLNALFYSIDQSPQAVPVSGLSLQGAAVKFAIPVAGITFEGRLSADASSIAGT